MNRLIWISMIFSSFKYVLPLTLAEGQYKVDEFSSVNNTFQSLTQTWTILTENLGEASRYLLENKLVSKETEACRYLANLFSELEISDKDVISAILEAGIDTTQLTMTENNLSLHQNNNSVFLDNFSEYLLEKIQEGQHFAKFFKKMSIAITLASMPDRTALPARKSGYSPCGSELILVDGFFIHSTIFTAKSGYCWVSERKNIMERLIKITIIQLESTESNIECLRLEDSRGWYAVLKFIREDWKSYVAFHQIFEPVNEVDGVFQYPEHHIS